MYQYDSDSYQMVALEIPRQRYASNRSVGIAHSRQIVTIPYFP